MKGRIIGHGDKTRYVLDGQDVSKETFDAAFPDRSLEGPGDGLVAWKGLASDALAVHPAQIAEAKADAEKKGLGQVEFTADGRPIFTCRSARNAYLKAYGYHDRDAGYGDVADGTYRGQKPTLEDNVDPAMVALMYSATGKRLREK